MIDSKAFELCFKSISKHCEFEDAASLIFKASDCDNNGYLDEEEFEFLMKILNNKIISTRYDLYSLIFDIIDNDGSNWLNINEMNIIYNTFVNDENEEILKQKIGSKITMSYDEYMRFIPLVDTFYNGKNN